MKKNNLEKEKRISYLHEIMRSCKKVFRFSMLCGAIINLLMLAMPIYSMQVLDRVISSNNLNTLLMLSIVIIIALSLLSLIQSGRAFALNRMGEWFESRLSKLVFANSISISLQSRTNMGSQKIRDLQTVKTFLISPQVVAMIDTPWAIIFIIVLFMLHIWIGLIALFGAIILVIMATLTDRLTKNLIEQNIEIALKSNRQVEQATKNAEVIEVMGLLDNIAKSWNSINNKVQNMQSLIRNRQIILEEITKFIRLLLQIAVTGTGAYLVIQGHITPGTIIASSALIGRALAPFDQFMAAWKGYINFKKAFIRLEKGFDYVAEENDKMLLPRPQGNIRFEGVFFTPNNTQHYTIKNASFSIETGDVVAVIGASASGKTTLAKLMVGAWYANMGTVRIDGTNICDWSRANLGQYIGYLPQDVELFSGTIRENIGRMDKNADPQKVMEAAMSAGVHEMILRLPKGYDTEIGTDGSILSGGQRQRMALARALFDNPVFLILDEPNASLDSAGDQALISAISTAKSRNITTVVISHRSSMLSVVNKVMVMKDGIIAAYGPKAQILQQMQKQAEEQNVIANTDSNR